jgi:ribosomal 30S subunit maturation factor RimM
LDEAQRILGVVLTLLDEGEGDAMLVVVAREEATRINLIPPFFEVFSEEIPEKTN